MNAAFITRTGRPEVIEYGDLPDPGPGQVLVRVETVAVNPIDTDVCGGQGIPAGKIVLRP